MKRLLILFSILIFLISVQKTYAQHEEASIIVNANLSLPIGDYGKNIGTQPHITRRFGFDFGEKVGLASTGYGIGAELYTPVFVDHLAWLISAKLILNPTDDTEINNYFSGVVDDTVSVSLETGTWFNIPVFTGLSYGLNITDGFNLYFSMQGGVNITKQASRKATVDGTLVEETTFDAEIDFGFGGGITVELLDKYSIGFKYLNLGKPRYEGNRYLDINYFDDAYLKDNPIFGDERTVQMFLITLGYKI